VTFTPILALNPDRIPGGGGGAGQSAADPFTLLSPRLLQRCLTQDRDGAPLDLHAVPARRGAQLARLPCLGTVSRQGGAV